MRDFNGADLVGFGDAVPPAVNDILQEGVFLYRHDPQAADARFRAANALDPSALASYFCLYKIHAYRGRLDDALAIARDGLAESARQAGLPSEWTSWTKAGVAAAAGEPAHFALYTLKAMAFIHLRRGEADESRRCLAKLAELDCLEAVGGSVVAELARGAQ